MSYSIQILKNNFCICISLQPKFCDLATKILDMVAPMYEHQRRAYFARWVCTVGKISNHPKETATAKLHFIHFGIWWMSKKLYIYMPGLDADLEKLHSIYMACIKSLEDTLGSIPAHLGNEYILTMVNIIYWWLWWLMKGGNPPLQLQSKHWY